MFHVEPGDVGQFFQRRRCFGGGDEDLCRSVEQALQNPRLMGAIQLRGQIIQGDHGPFAALFRIVLGLGQQAGQCRQLGLAAGQRITTRDAVEIHTPVRPVGADRGIPGLPVTFPREKQGIRQGKLMPPPTGAQLQSLDTKLRSQARGQGHGALLQAFQVVLPTAGQRFSGLGQLMIPGIEHPRRPALLEQGVALLQRPGVAAPQGQKIRFHVEQAPIEEAAAGFTTTADQRMATGLEGHYRQRCAEIAQLRDIFAVQSSLPVLATVAQASLAAVGRVMGTLFVPFHEDFQRFLALAYQSIADPTTEAAPIRHQVEGFQHTGLAGTVVTGQQVQSWLGRQVHRTEATQLVQGEAADKHGARRTIRTGR